MYVARTPILSNLSSSVRGVTTIRAFGVSKEMETNFENHLNVQTRTNYARLSAFHWIGATVDTTVTIFIDFLIVTMMLSNGKDKNSRAEDSAYS